MILIILDSLKQKELCQEYLEKNPPSCDYRIFVHTGNGESFPLEWESRKIDAPEFTIEEKNTIDETGINFAIQWGQLVASQTAANHRGISLADLAIHGLDYFWIWVIKQFLAVEKILANFKPEKVVLGYGPAVSGVFSAPKENYYARAAFQICASKEIKVEELNRPAVTAPEAQPSVFFPLYEDKSKWISGFTDRLSGTLQKLRDSKGQVGMLASLRVGKPLLAEKQFDWVYLTPVSSPRTFLELFRKGIPTFHFLGLPEQDPASELTSGETFFSENKEELLFNFHGIPLLSIAEPRLYQVWNYEFPLFRQIIDLCFAFFKASFLNAIVMDEDTTILHKAVALTARKLRIPVIVVQHGNTGQKRGYVPFSSSKFCTWGEISKQQLISWGIPADQIEITGFPSLPKRESISKSRAQILRRLHVPPTHRVFFYAPSRIIPRDQGTLRIKLTAQEHFEFFRACVEAVNAIPNASLVVKVHPGGKAADFEGFLDRIKIDSKSNIRIIEEFNLHELLSVTDILINFASTVSIEAMAFNIPIINANLFGKTDYIPFGENPPVYQVKKANELLPAILRALDNPAEMCSQRSGFLELYCGPQDGQSTNRVLDVIHKEIRASKRIQRTGIIIQARMDSLRLPGKVMMPLAGKPALEHLIERVRLVCDSESIVIATSVNKTDDLIADLGKKLNVKVFRGSLPDVLDRYYQCAKNNGFDPVVRITGDCPCLEPAYLADLITTYSKTQADYVTAKNPKLFPRGTTAEIFSFASLEEAWHQGKETEDREHVTWYINHHPDRFRAETLKARPEWSNFSFRLALDENDDYHLLNEIFNRLYHKNSCFNLNDIMTLYHEDPELFEKNKHVTAKTG